MAENHNLYARFHKVFEDRLDKILLVTDAGNGYRYADIESESARLAGFLAAAGALPGDRISVQVAKTPQALCLYLACLRGGYVFHPLNTGYRADELEYFFSDAEPAVTVCDSRNLDMIGPLVQQLSIPHLFTLDGDGSGTLADRSRDTDDAPVIVHRGKDDMAALLYSSGTTGKPKGIVLTHNNLYASARTLVQAWGFTEDDILLHALPIYHVHGLFVALGCVLLSGATMRWLPAFDAGKVIDLLPQCTAMMGVPTYYTRLLASEGFTGETAAHMRLFISGSAPLLEETFHAFEDCTGHRILERYGTSETNMNTSNPLSGERRPGSVGPPLPGVEVRICNAAGTVLPGGETGNIQVRGENVFREYWRMPEKTAEDFTEDGFFNTGDLGVIDEDGYVSIVGRSKDLIITGGLNVYPAEVEGIINDMAGVRESAVIGVPHPDFGEAVVAVIVCAPGATLNADQVTAHAKDRLAGYKAPKHVAFVDELPRNTMGKVQKNLLRDEYKDLFRL
ncbi:MAG: malonyl-CoA synthase [Gammaproteobacteria bacterium]|nr:malonyl-CoA synthase [Gammaproteobacteria bacterium]